MTDKEAAKILAILTAAYPHTYKKMTPDEAYGTVLVWKVQFADVPADIVLMAVNKAISTCKYPPSVCEVKQKLEALYWEAYELIAQHNRKAIILDEKALKDVQRIYSITSQYRHTWHEIGLKNMIGTDTTKFLIEGG